MDADSIVSNVAAMLPDPPSVRLQLSSACLEAAAHAITLAFQVDLLARDPPALETNSSHADLVQQATNSLKEAVDATLGHINAPKPDLRYAAFTASGSLSATYPDSFARTLRGMIKNLFRQADKVHGNQEKSPNIDYWRARMLSIFVSTDQPAYSNDALAKAKQMAKDLDMHSLTSQRRPISDAWRGVFMVGIGFALQTLHLFTAEAGTPSHSNAQNTNLAATEHPIQRQAEPKRVTKKHKIRSGAVAASAAKEIRTPWALAPPRTINNLAIRLPSVDTATGRAAECTKETAAGKQTKKRKKRPASDAGLDTIHSSPEHDGKRRRHMVPELDVADVDMSDT